MIGGRGRTGCNMPTFAVRAGRRKIWIVGCGMYGEKNSRRRGLRLVHIKAKSHKNDQQRLQSPIRRLTNYSFLHLWYQKEYVLFGKIKVEYIGPPLSALMGAVHRHQTISRAALLLSWLLRLTTSHLLIMSHPLHQFECVHIRIAGRIMWCKHVNMHKALPRPFLCVVVESLC